MATKDRIFKGIVNWWKLKNWPERFFKVRLSITIKVHLPYRELKILLIECLMPTSKKSCYSNWKKFIFQAHSKRNELNLVQVKRQVSH